VNGATFFGPSYFGATYWGTTPSGVVIPPLVIHIDPRAGYVVQAAADPFEIDPRAGRLVS
jgi:hypothetical protein